jgi:RNA polymerase sigma factor (sigma-70 family)
VRNALNGLDGSSCRVVELRYFRELSYGEIADLVGITRSNVGVRLNRALSRMKEALTKTLMPKTVLP